MYSYLISVIWKETQSEKLETEKFLASMVFQSVTTIQNELLDISRILQSERDSDNNANADITNLGSILEDYLANTEYAGIINSAWLVMEGDITEFIPLTGVSNNLLFPENYAIWQKSSKERFYEMIYLHNFKGFIAIPLRMNHKREITELVLIGIAIESAIREHIPEIIQNNLKQASFRQNHNDLEFNISIKWGVEFYDNGAQNDLLLDLSTIFYKQQLQTVINVPFWNIPGRSRNNPVVENHLYLGINHKSGNLRIYYTKEFRLLLLILTIIYLLLISALTIMVISIIKMNRNTEREREFTALISHELKTPLSVISLSAENLSSGYITDSKGIFQYGELIKNEARKLKQLINNILAVSTTSWITESKESYSIDSIITELEKANNSYLQETGIALSVKNNCPDIKLVCSKTTLIIAFNNILQNGIRYGAGESSDKTVYISVKQKTKRKRPGISISFIDYGPGISWSDHKNLFKPFYRGKTADQTNPKGTGIGLAVANRIIKFHKGQLICLKTLKKGATFEVWIPSGDIK